MQVHVIPHVASWPCMLVVAVVRGRGRGRRSGRKQTHLRSGVDLGEQLQGRSRRRPAARAGHASCRPPISLAASGDPVDLRPEPGQHRLRLVRIEARAGARPPSRPSVQTPSAAARAAVSGSRAGDRAGRAEDQWVVRRGPRRSAPIDAPCRRRVARPAAGARARCPVRATPRAVASDGSPGRELAIERRATRSGSPPDRHRSAAYAAKASCDNARGPQSAGAERVHVGQVAHESGADRGLEAAGVAVRPGG